MDKEQVIRILREKRPALARFHVRSLSVFGSVVRGEAGPDSDIDILVEFEPGARVGLFHFARLQRFLQETLGREVDLATPKALHKSLKNDILEEAVHAF
jgi:predicted nucleotidyltransferase